MDARKELLDAVEIMIDRKMSEVAEIHTGVVTEIRGNTPIIMLNGNIQGIKVYGKTPQVGATIPVFIPHGNMSLAFAISP